MNVDDINTIFDLYLFVAIIVCIFVAINLEKRLKKRIPATRPYRWGFYVGSMGVACAPLALLMAVVMLIAGLNGRWEAVGLCLICTAFFALHTVCGWFIIQRKRWAWVVGTIFSLNIFTWIINYIYGRNRWAEFAGQPYGSAGTEDEGFELLTDATKLETQGRVQEALAAYQHI